MNDTFISRWDGTKKNEGLTVIFTEVSPQFGAIHRKPYQDEQSLSEV